MDAVERLMTENVVNRGKRKHNITFARSGALLHCLILREVKSRKPIIYITLTVGNL